jgi:hypothetical protein
MAREIECAGVHRGDGPCKRAAFPSERYSLGIYAGTWCDKHWESSGYRDEPASAFDPMDAGERYESDDC